MSAANPLHVAIQKAQRLLQQNQADEALEALNGVLTDDPDNAEALLTVAVAERARGNHDQALQTLDKLLSLRPNFGRALQEKGINEVGKQNLVAAGRAFEDAVNADPALLNSWQALAKLYHDSGQAADAANAKDKVSFL
ncbi:MAG: tetratricopeptide repeat protein, partial [Pseudomonadota bacterium]